MAPVSNPGTSTAAQRTAHCVTRDEVAGALGRAVAEVQGIAGDDETIDLIAEFAAGQPPGGGPFTYEEAVAAWNAAAEAAQDRYNPDEGETSDTIRKDSLCDLVVNLAAGFLHDPASDTDDVISGQWADLEPGSLEEYQVWNRHDNDLGDYCPWSGQQATPGNREALVSGLDPGDDRCPQGCRASELEDPPVGSALYRAAIIATVKGWVG